MPRALWTEVVGAVVGAERAEGGVEVATEEHGGRRVVHEQEAHAARAVAVQRGEREAQEVGGPLQ